MPDIWDEHKKLYHYTNWDGLLGILKSKSLWATHYRFLNDSSEFTFFGNRLISLLEGVVDDEYERLRGKKSRAGRRSGPSADPNSFATNFVNILVSSHYKVTEREVYIASFCGEHKESPYVQDNGLLSQWRAYGPGGGFALVFDTRKLWDLLALEAKRFPADGIHLSTCVYSDDEDTFEREFSEQIGTLAENAKRFVGLALNRKLNEHDQTALYEETLWPFVFCCSRYKHCGFKEENEVRVVIAPAPFEAIKDGITSIARQSRYRNGQCTPYVSLFESSEITSAVERVIVGPCKDKMSRAAAVRVILGATHIEVTCSDIPFVGQPNGTGAD